MKASDLVIVDGGPPEWRWLDLYYEVNRAFRDKEYCFRLQRKNGDFFMYYQDSGVLIPIKQETGRLFRGTFQGYTTYLIWDTRQDGRAVWWGGTKEEILGHHLVTDNLWTRGKIDSSIQLTEIQSAIFKRFMGGL